MKDDDAATLIGFFLIFGFWLFNTVSYITGVVLGFKAHLVVGCLALFPLFGWAFGALDIVTFNHVNLAQIVADALKQCFHG